MSPFNIFIKNSPSALLAEAKSQNFVTSKVSGKQSIFE